MSACLLDKVSLLKLRSRVSATYGKSNFGGSWVIRSNSGFLHCLQLKLPFPEWPFVSHKADTISLNPLFVAGLPLDLKISTGRTRMSLILGRYTTVIFIHRNLLTGAKNEYNRHSSILRPRSCWLLCRHVACCACSRRSGHQNRYSPDRLRRWTGCTADGTRAPAASPEPIQRAILRQLNQHAPTKRSRLP